jgi:hypothetical protein
MNEEDSCEFRENPLEGEEGLSPGLPTMTTSKKK